MINGAVYGEGEGEAKERDEEREAREPTPISLVCAEENPIFMESPELKPV